ncbi:hypothetical protein BDD12DRAFT_840999 [Trichophaea hybrida]|nr:hypothetical protein BDD12DRAFT_840999 [Trichophaea hybrida]
MANRREQLFIDLFEGGPGFPIHAHTSHDINKYMRSEFKRNVGIFKIRSRLRKGNNQQYNTNYS